MVVTALTALGLSARPMARPSSTSGSIAIHSRPRVRRATGQVSSTPAASTPARNTPTSAGSTTTIAATSLPITKLRGVSPATVS